MDVNALVHRETIIDALWGEEPPATASNLIQTYVSRLRKALDHDRTPRDRKGLIASLGACYQFQIGPGQLDLLEFCRLTDRARAARSRGDALASCHFYEQALRFWRQRPLADLDSLRRHVAVAEVTAQWATTVLEYAEVAPAAGWHDRVLPHLRTLTAQEPLDEKAHAHMILVLAGSGHQAAALQVYESLRIRLDEELGIQPGEDLINAYLRVLHQDVIAGPDALPGKHRISVPSRRAG